MFEKQEIYVRIRRKKEPINIWAIYKSCEDENGLAFIKYVTESDKSKELNKRWKKEVKLNLKDEKEMKNFKKSFFIHRAMPLMCF